MDTPASSSLPMPGDNVIAPRPCNAPACTRRTTLFIAADDRIIHFCAEHVTWAARESGLQGWWKERE